MTFYPYSATWEGLSPSTGSNFPYNPTYQAILIVLISLWDASGSI